MWWKRVFRGAKECISQEPVINAGLFFSISLNLLFVSKVIFAIYEHTLTFYLFCNSLERPSHTTMQVLLLLLLKRITLMIKFLLSLLIISCKLREVVLKVVLLKLIGVSCLYKSRYKQY